MQWTILGPLRVWRQNPSWKELRKTKLHPSAKRVNHAWTLHHFQENCWWAGSQRKYLRLYHNSHSFDHPYNNFINLSSKTVEIPEQNVWKEELSWLSQSDVSTKHLPVFLSYRFFSWMSNVNLHNLSVFQQTPELHANLDSYFSCQCTC